MLNLPKSQGDVTRCLYSSSWLPSVVLTGILLSPASAVELTSTATIPLDPATPSVNTLDVDLDAVGSITTDLGFPLGTVTIPINASDSETTTISGALLCEFELEVDPDTLAVDVLSIAFEESPITLDDDPSFNLNLGSYLLVPLGSVSVNGANLVATPHTPVFPGTVTGTTFPLFEHDLRLYQGTINGAATGIAADFIDPIAIDLAVTPLVGPLGVGDGTVVLSSPVQVGSEVTYDVVVTFDADFASLVLTDPVDVTVSATGDVSATGTLTVQLPPPGPIEVLSVVAGSPATTDVTITWDSDGGAGTYRVLSSMDLLAPIASWTVEAPSVVNGGATTSFTDAGVLLTDDGKYYVIEEN